MKYLKRVTLLKHLKLVKLVKHLKLVKHFSLIPTPEQYTSPSSRGLGEENTYSSLETGATIATIATIETSETLLTYIQTALGPDHCSANL